MASDNDKETYHKTSQEIWATSLLLQTYTGGRTLGQPNLICIQWKLMSGNTIPEGKPPRIWFIVLIHHWNKKNILSP